MRKEIGLRWTVWAVAMLTVLVAACGETVVKEVPVEVVVEKVVVREVPVEVQKVVEVEKEVVKEVVKEVPVEVVKEVEVIKEVPKVITEEKVVVREVEKIVVATAVPVGEKKFFTPAQGRRGGHLRTAIGFWPSTLDMTEQSSWQSPGQFARHYSGLLQLSPRDGTTVIPDLAEVWEMSEDLGSITLKLRSGVKWHDGKSLTTEDIIYSLNRWANPPAGVRQPRVGGFKNIKMVEKIDERTVRIDLQNPSIDFVPDLADSWHIMVPKHIVEITGSIDSPEKMIGTGPFVVKRIEEGSHVLSVANPNYFLTAPDGKPYPLLEQITSIAITNIELKMAALRTQQVDLAAPLRASEAPKGYALANELKGRVTIEVMLSPGVVFIQLNGERPPFDDFKARKAVYLAIDRQQIIDIQYPPEGPASMVSFFGTADPFIADVPTYPGYDPNTRDQQVAEAKRLFAEIGLKEFDLWTGAPPGVPPQLVQQQLEEMGVKVNIRSQEIIALRAREAEGDYQASFEGYGMASPNPMNFVSLLYSPGAGAFAHAAQPPDNWVRVYEKALKTRPGADRNVLFKQMDTIMREEWIPKIPLLRPDEYKIAWTYVRNIDAIPSFKFIQTKYIDAWLDENAPFK